MGDTLGPKYQIRLGDLNPWHVLRVTCFKCRHVANVSHAPLLTRFGQHRRLTDLEDRFVVSNAATAGETACRFTKLGTLKLKPDVYRALTCRLLNRNSQTVYEGPIPHVLPLHRTWRD